MKPPKLVKAPEGCKPWFTPGKEYEVVGIWADWDDENGYGFCIIDDDLDERYLFEKECAHLHGQDWIIISREN